MIKHTNLMKIIDLLYGHYDSVVKHYPLINGWFKASVEEKDQNVLIKLMAPGFSKAKIIFKKSMLVVKFEEDSVNNENDNNQENLNENECIFKIDEEFYKIYDVQSTKSEFKNGILYININKFPDSIKDEKDEDLVYSINVE